MVDPFPVPPSQSSLNTTSPSPITQEPPPIMHDRSDSPPPMQEFPLEDERVTHHVLLDELLSDSNDDIATGIAQARHDFVGGYMMREVQAIRHIINAMPHFRPLPTHLLPDTTQIAAVRTVIQQTKPLLDSTPLLSRGLSIELPLQPLRAALDVLQSSSVAAPSQIASIAAASMPSSAALMFPQFASLWTEPLRAFGDHAAWHVSSFLHESLYVGIAPAIACLTQVNSVWDVLAPSLSALALPTWNIANTLPVMSSFLPDMRWLDNLTDALNTLLRDVPPWESLKGLKDRIKQRLFVAFKNVGLCFAPSMSEEFMYRIVDVLESSGKQGVMLLVWNYYARDNHRRLRQTVEGWQDNPVYARLWKTFLEPALRSHVNKDYGMSIYALTPHVEGISSHIVQRNTLVPAKKPRRGQLGLGSTENIILRALQEIGDAASLENSVTSIGQWVRVKSLLDFVEDVFCKDLGFESHYDSIHLHEQLLNRHGMLHGIQTNAAGAFNSLRLFLLFDTIYGLLQSYLARGGKI